ncbi:hypothetical protein [Paraburkholderia phenazinium]|uniref:Uncharacterized protein n=1 Tax=Paraburkholderia phenazinium TaxID=60549 RepID=A0A1N6KPG8_9BURK|nr:hypothetical protein [Paraburkholderia phenazinium]SIO58414.1 hypothetical protein SAMN05444165_4136 [Paraburkholderia phenazinium]
MLGELVTATRTHALMMAPHMRAAEVREIMASDGLTPIRGLLRELDRSSSAWSWIIDGEVACMFGIITPYLLDQESYPWMLTTPLVESNSRQFARACRALLPELLAVHPKLSGMVDARYELSVRWLGWLGAKISSPEPWGAEGVPFCRFEIGA